MRTIGVFFTVYFHFFKGLFLYPFSGSESKLKCSMDTLLNDFSFRAPVALNFFHFFLKITKDGLMKIWGKHKEEPLLLLDAGSPYAIFEGSFKHNKLIKDDYLGELFNIEFNFIAVYQNIFFTGKIFSKLLLSFIYLSGFLFVLPAILFLSKPKVALYGYFELIEIIAASDILIKRKVNSVFTFLSYEKSSNFLSFILEKYNIALTKICSPNPIKIHYKKVVADRFVFTAPYQKEEYESLKGNWHVRKTELWPVYDFKKYRQQYQGKELSEAGNKLIGFYSSAFFRRTEVGDNNLNIDYKRSEEKLLELLNEFLIRHPVYSLKIYLHPLEKSTEEVYQRSIGYYRDFFSQANDRLVFHPRTEATWLDFRGVNVAISVSSTISFERLYCGFKSVYAPLCFDKGFFDGTSLEVITIKEPEKFDKILLKNLELSEQQFFEMNKIKEYVYY